MYTLKSIARRGSMLGFAVAMVAATVLPAASAYAQAALNPLTQRSLLLTSSAPGFQDSDGSNYSEAQRNPINTNYAPAGSGPNGMKTGQKFTFRVSSSAVVKGLSFQYCTVAAGLCRAPGTNTGSGVTREANGETVPGDGTGGHKNGRSDFDVVSAFTYNNSTTKAPGTFQVFVNGDLSDAEDWAFAKSNREVDVADWDNKDDVNNVPTGKNNYVTLTSSTGQQLDYENGSGSLVEVVFTPSETVYITNPGADEFFVKINTYKSDTALTGENIVDGGVTVANVMTDSIHITTKVLETMSFSVGTRNDDTHDVTEGVVGSQAKHGTCDPIKTINGNQLQLGDVNSEYSLQTGQAHEVSSYWRLSSNSSGGATVYYSGNTLQNTVGDEIQEIGEDPAESLPGTEQFGLAFIDAGADTFDPAFTALVTAENSRHKIPTLLLQAADAGAGTPDIFLLPEPAYANGTGSLDPEDAGAKAAFAFQKSSNTVPVRIAQNNEMVISCATAKMRYMANIGADTPAGVYTTKINYLAAPQY